MNLKARIKMIIDIAMSITLFVSMSYQFMEQKNHEVAGAIMFVMFILHHIMNYRWYLSLAKGRYSSQRILLTVIDFVILVDMLALMISGIRMSNYVFDFINLKFSMELARNLHMIASYGGFLLIGLHIGLHYGMILRMVRKVFHITESSGARIFIMRCIAGLVSVYGVYALIKRNFISYITLQMHFVFFDFNESAIYYVLDLFAIMILMIFIGYYSQRILIYFAQSKKKN